MSENVYRCYPDSSSPGSDSSENKPEARRGRPKAAMISNLMMEGATSASGIRCEVCSRVFPRDKSLQAHRRVHTGERPYSCDYPGCGRKFKQSGQLKTHQRLHTGERPFICSVEGCSSRFTHANRHCASHPQAPLTRSEDTVLLDIEQSTQSEEVRQWLVKYRAEKETKTVEKKETGTPQASNKRLEVMTPKSEDRDPIHLMTNTILDRELADMTNFTNATNPVQPVPGGGASLPWSPLKSPLRLSPLKTPRLTTADRSRPVKNLFLTEPTVTHISPRKRELPKKRWLRIACREYASHSVTSPTLSANLCRPTVLRHAGEFLSPPPVSPASHSVTPITQPLLHSLLTPPYSDEKKFYHEDDEELAVPLPPHDQEASVWHSPAYTPELLH
uniref:Zinc finger protein 367 n=1 Tax=Lygus hesperus TaxID=30085 RepID=A0A146LIA1_LYGHE